jgi:hypothetical protein
VASAELDNAGLDPWLTEAVDRLVRGEKATFDELLVSVGDPSVIGETLTTFRCHFLSRDANGTPRVDALARTLAAQVVDYCIPRGRVVAALDAVKATGSTEQFGRLQAEARELFTKAVKSGEGGELLLYLLLERMLRLPQLLCKMAFKTSTEVHVHGTDGIHGRVLANGNLALYWGESKLYATVNRAIDDCLASISPFLNDESGEARRRDVLLLRDHLDASDPILTEALRRFFVEEDPLSAHVEFRGACLVGFSLDAYPAVEESQVPEMAARWLERVKSRLGDHDLARFEIEVFCLPFPSVDEFRLSVRKRLGLV